MVTLARGVGFVALHTLLVAAWLLLLTRTLPPLANEPPSLFVLPVVALAALSFAVMHPVLRAQRTHAQRLGTLAVATLASMSAYAGYLAAALRAGDPLAFALFALVSQLLYGAPMVLGVALCAKLTSPLLIARPVRA